MFQVTRDWDKHSCSYLAYYTKLIQLSSLLEQPKSFLVSNPIAQTWTTFVSTFLRVERFSPDRSKHI
jgi:hypothetical protein